MAANLKIKSILCKTRNQDISERCGEMGGGLTRSYDKQRQGWTGVSRISVEDQLALEGSMGL